MDGSLHLEWPHYLLTCATYPLGLSFPLDKRNITHSLKILDRPSHLTSTINQVWVAKTSQRYGGDQDFWKCSQSPAGLIVNKDRHLRLLKPILVERFKKGYFLLGVWALCSDVCLCSVRVPDVLGDQKVLDPDWSYRQLWAATWVSRINPGQLQDQQESSS